MIVMMGLVICCVLTPGRIDFIPKNLVQKPARVFTEPETGITAWIVAVNDRDFGAVYDLMPSSKRAGITSDQYVQLNRENPAPFLAMGIIVTDFVILDKNVEGLNATIIAGLQTTRYSSVNTTTPIQNTVFFTFEETFEDYEWKVWTR
jgi:hypothetical protein